MKYKEFEKFINVDRTESVTFCSKNNGEVTLSVFNYRGYWSIDVGPLSIHFDDASYFVAGRVDLYYRRDMVGSLNISDLKVRE